MRLSPILLSALLGSACIAQSPQATLVLSTLNGQTTFHLGERIPLTLTFSGSAADRVNTSSYDRSGRLSIDTYTISPSTGFTDPLDDYYSHSVGLMGGGLFSINTLAKPFHITRDLNEWVRFDQPGDYTVTAVSSRVSRTPHRSLDGKSSDALQSQPLTLHILAAAPEWQQATIARIQQTLASPHQRVKPGDTDPRAEALTELSYLATPASIPVLASYIREDSDIPNASWIASAGLYGLPPSLHDNALTALDHLLDDPGFPITNSFLFALQNLERPPGEPAPSGRDGFLASSAAAQARADTIWRTAVAALTRKQGAALANSAQVLLADASQHPSDQNRAALASILAANFLALSSDRRTAALQQSWDQLRSPAMLPILRTLAQPQHPHVDHYPHNLPAIALRRWFDLDPDSALREIAAQIGSATPTLTAEDLWFLPPQSFPQFESIWAAALDANKFSDSQVILSGLLARFGTGSASSAVAAVLNASVGKDVCIVQSPRLAYLVRFNPDAAGPLLARAVAARGPRDTACRHMLFTDVARYASGPVLIHAAIQALNDPDLEVVTDATRFLTDYADTSARQPLLDRFLQWSDAWSTHASGLNTSSAFDEPQPHYLDRSLGPLLGEALLSNQGWLPDAALTATVHTHCLTDECRGLSGAPTSPVYIQIFPFANQEQLRIAQFHPSTRALFESKIAQFPEGTTFTFGAFPSSSNDARPPETFVRATLKRHHMVLAPLPKPQTQKD